MPIFISYSHQDKMFVDRFAKQLVQYKVNVWLDRWELNVGDSVINKIQSAIEGASALIIILSKASVDSEWCKKELSSGLIRELEEKRVVVLPVIIDNCKIPLFLKDKLYADFRSNYDDGFRTVLESIAKVTSNFQSRIDEPELLLDWSVDWGSVNKNLVLNITMVEQAKGQPYTVLNEIAIIADKIGTKEYEKLVENGNREFANYKIITLLKYIISDKLDLRILLQDQQPMKRVGTFKDNRNVGNYKYIISTRRMGEDTGRNILFNLGDQVALIKKILYEVNKPQSDVWDQDLL